MATVNLSNESQQIITGNDNIVIVDVFATVRGGRSLEVTGFTPLVINAGHVIIKETATSEYKPMPIASATTYGTLPAGHTYAGVLIASILTAKAFAAILTQGTINPVAAPYDFATIAAAFKTAMPLIDQRAD